MVTYYGYFSIELIFHLNYLNLPFHIGIFNFMKIANVKNTTKNTITIFYHSNIFDYYIGRTHDQMTTVLKSDYSVHVINNESPQLS